MSLYVDCHNHLADDIFGTDIADVIRGAQSAGVTASLVCAEFVKDFQRILHLHSEFPEFIAPCLGVHPVQREKDDKSKEISANLEHLIPAEPLMMSNVNLMFAVGEIGLDFQPRIAPNSDYRDIQREVLRRQVKFAMENDLPVNVHSRSAGKPTIQTLKECNAKNVLLHAFDGKPSAAMEGIKEGYFFSIPPSIVRSEQKQKLVKTIPLDHILLETDSPALGPDRENRNVPENIRISCEEIARIKNISIKDVQDMTFSNSLKLFPKLSGITNVIETE
ncbi:hypothetical protein FSP39_012138 [Pinctada imbricata]|uniref:Uncharacterized protein n=1 Tax=Pinctada imbricata TaxID=66713 RepID=A0AA88Y429_PINIB|nr:hypothetical protein FSP39_012138 [Pinctada imbricata]